MKIFSRRILIACQIVLSLLLIGWLIHLANGQTLMATLSDLAPGLFIAALGLFGFANLLGAYRLQVILRALNVDVSLAAAVKLTWLGLFASNFLPSSVGGDAVIAAVLHQRREKLGPVLTGLILNRLINLGALVLMLPIALIPEALDKLRPQIMAAVSWSALGGLGIVIVAAGLAVILRSANAWSRLSGVVAKLNTLLRTAFAAQRTMWFAGLISLVVLAFGASAMAVLAKAQLPESNFLAVAGIVLLLQIVQLVPITFNGIGLMESATTFCLTQIGWPLHEAVAFSLAMRLLTIMLSLPGLLVALSYMRTTWKRA